MENIKIINSLYNNNIANISTIDIDYIGNLVEKYTNISESAIINMTSKYINIAQYVSYVYYIYDTDKHKWYIGVRYRADRYSEDCLEDLKMYQSSSSNKLFKKRLKEDINYGVGRFKLGILQTFNNEFDAMNYEALCHQIFNVDVNKLFYNNKSENFKEYIVYSTIYWDIKDKIELSYLDMKNYNISYSSLAGLAKNKILISNFRYCNTNNRDNATIFYLKHNYDMRYNSYAMYYINQYGWGYKLYTNKSIYEWAKYLHDTDIYKVLNDELSNAGGYCLYEHKLKEIIKRQYIESKLVTLYTTENNVGIQYTKPYKEWVHLLGSSFITLIKLNTLKHVNGYYKNYEDWLYYFKENNEIIEIYVASSTSSTYYVVYNTIRYFVDNVDSKFRSIIRGHRKSIKNHFYNKKYLIEYLQRYNNVDLFYNINNKIHIENKSDHEWQLLNNDYTYMKCGKIRSILDKTTNIRYYINKSDCEDDYLVYTLVDIHLKYIQVYKSTGSNIIGSSDFLKLIKGTRKSVKNYSLLKYNELRNF